jgi:gamma-glutamyltranspeptidase/glutathione hydrolase
LLAACVPGMFDTWMLLLRDYGTMHLADVLAPAIAYARDGHPIVERASATIAMVENLFREHWPTSAAVYLPGGDVPKPGTMFANRPLAETYTRVLREAESAGSDRVKQIELARKVWSQGFIAEAIDRFCRTQDVMDVTGERHRGLLAPTWLAGKRMLSSRSLMTTAVTRFAKPASGARVRWCCSNWQPKLGD